MSQTFIWNCVCVWWFTKLHYSTSKRLRSHAALTTKAILYTRYWQKTLHASQNHMLSVQRAKSYAVSRRWPFLTLFLCSRLQSRVSNQPCLSHTLLSLQTASRNELCGVFWRFTSGWCWICRYSFACSFICSSQTFHLSSYSAQGQEEMVWLTYKPSSHGLIQFCMLISGWFIWTCSVFVDCCTENFYMHEDFVFFWFCQWLSMIISQIQSEIKLCVWMLSFVASDNFDWSTFHVNQSFSCNQLRWQNTAILF